MLKDKSVAHPSLVTYSGGMGPSEGPMTMVTCGAAIESIAHLKGLPFTTAALNDENDACSWVPQSLRNVAVKSGGLSLHTSSDRAVESTDIVWFSNWG